MTSHDPQQPPVLWHLTLNGQGGARADGKVDWRQLNQESQFLWVHMRSDVPGTADKMRALNIPEAVVDALTVNETRPKAFAMEGGTLIYLRGINHNAGSEPEDMVSLRLWVTPGLIISARKKDRRLYSVEDVRAQLDSGKGPGTQGEFIGYLLERIADRISEKVDAIDDELTEYETRLASDSGDVDRNLLSVIRRKSASLRRFLAPQRDALDALYRMRGNMTNDEAYQLREQSDRMSRYVEELELAKERAIVLQEELRNRIAEQQNVRMYVLSMVTAIFLPLSFLTGVFGMNVAGLPGLEEPGAFMYLSLSMGAVAVLMILAMVWKKWL